MDAKTRAVTEGSRNSRARAADQGDRAGAKQPGDQVSPALQVRASVSGSKPGHRLGRGLDALFPVASRPATSKSGESAPQSRDAGTEVTGEDGRGATRRSHDGELLQVAIEALHPNRQQPRRHFDAEALEELVSSVKAHGILEPVLVRPLEARDIPRSSGRVPASDTQFEIVAGERRWRAAQKAGLREVPVLVRLLDDRHAFEIALVENLQREDLNPVEIARGLQRLIDEHGHRHDTLGEIIGKDRSTVANALRLLKLPEDVLMSVATGELSEGHGRAILGAPDPQSMRQLARLARENGWSVRETERQAKRLRSASAKPAPSPKSANVTDLEHRLSDLLGAQVRIDDKGGKGAVVIRYGDLDALDALIARLSPA